MSRCCFILPYLTLSHLWWNSFPGRKKNNNDNNNKKVSHADIRMSIQTTSMNINAWIQIFTDKNMNTSMQTHTRTLIHWTTIMYVYKWREHKKHWRHKKKGEMKRKLDIITSFGPDFNGEFCVATANLCQRHRQTVGFSN